jgi:hypothetical protein
MGADNLGTISPDWEDQKNQPTLELVVLSSKSAGGTVDISSNLIKWYLDGTELTFSSVPGNDSSGYFYKDSSGKLKIIKNLADKTHGISCNIKASATVNADGYQDTVTASTSVSIKKSSGTSTKVTIIAGDDNNFKITSNDGSCKLAVTVFSNGAYVDSLDGYTFEWYKLSKTSWTKVGTGTTYTVQGTDVDTYADFKVMVYNSGGSLIGSDIAGVWDVSDGYYILPGASPADETIIEGADNNFVKYTPKLYSRNSSGSDTLVSGTKYYFTVLDSVGGSVSSSGSTAVETFTVTEENVKDFGNVTINIESAD